MAQAPTLDPPAAPPYRRMSYEEFLEDTCEEHAEWVDGEVIPMATVSEFHNATTRWLIHILSTLVEESGIGRIFHEPFNQKLPASSGRSPDVMILLAAHMDRMRLNHLDGPADVVIEVLSSGTAGVDRGDKYLEYEAAGVAEYWLFDLQRQVAEFYRLAPNGRYQLVPVEAGGRFESAVLPGIWLQENWLWERPALRILEAAYGLR